MSFPRVNTVQVEKRKLLVIRGLIGEVRLHMAQYDMENPAHQDYVHTRLAKVEEMATELYGFRPGPSECMD